MAENTCIYHYDWDKEIQEFKDSGLKMQEFCKHKEYPYTAFSYHYYKKRREAAEKLPVSFVPLVPVSTGSHVELQGSDQTIQINGLKIRITEYTNIISLKKVLQALEEL